MDSNNLTQVMKRQNWGQMPWRTSVVIVKTPKVLNCVPKFQHYIFKKMLGPKTNQNTFCFWQGSEETVLGWYLAKQQLLSPPLPIAQPCPHSVHPITLASCMAISVVKKWLFTPREEIKKYPLLCYKFYYNAEYQLSTNRPCFNAPFVGHSSGL